MMTLEERISVCESRLDALRDSITDSRIIQPERRGELGELMVLMARVPPPVNSYAHHALVVRAIARSLGDIALYGIGGNASDRHDFDLTVCGLFAQVVELAQLRGLTSTDLIRSARSAAVDRIQAAQEVA